MRRTVLITAATAALLLLASPSSAAPDRSLTLSDSARTASWDSSLGVGTYVGSPAVFERTRCAHRDGVVVTCDQTLIQLKTPGDLTVRISTQLPRDVYSHSLELRRSDAAGEEGTPTALRRDRSASDLRYTADRLTRGYYLLTVSWDEGVGDYTGRAGLQPRTR